jgi:hypothetical protein
MHFSPNLMPKVDKSTSHTGIRSIRSFDKRPFGVDPFDGRACDVGRLDEHPVSVPFGGPFDVRACDVGRLDEHPVSVPVWIPSCTCLRCRHLERTSFALLQNKSLSVSGPQSHQVFHKP